MIKQERFSITGIKIAAIIVIGMLVGIVFFSAREGIIRFYIMAFLAFIGLPAMWIIIRGDKSGDRDGIYPIKSDDKEEPITEIGVFGTSRTMEYSRVPLDTRIWLHPDIETFVELQNERKKASVNEVNEQEKISNIKKDSQSKKTK